MIIKYISDEGDEVNVMNEIVNIDTFDSYKILIIRYSCNGEVDTMILKPDKIKKYLNRLMNDSNTSKKEKNEIK